MNNDQVDTGWGFAGFSVAVLLLLVLWMYRETVLYVTAYWNRWDSGEFYAHGYLTLTICLYLVYRQRHTLARLTPCVSATALAAVAASSLIWLVAAVTDVLMVQTIALLLLILSVLWATLGNQVIRHLVIPVLILIFAIPIWSPLPPILQEVTTDATFRIVRLIGMTVFRQEQQLIFPAGQLSVDEGCSGVSYLLPALVLGMLYAYLNYRTFWPRLLVVVIAGTAAILANILRVIIVVQQAYVTDMQTPLVNDHFNLGWYLFGGLVFSLLLVDYGIARCAGSAGGEGQLYEEAVATGCAHAYSRQLMMFVATGILLASGPVISWWSQNQSGAVQTVEVIMPAGAGGWSGPSVSSDTWMPVFHGAVAGKSAYQKDEHELYLYIGYYPKQEQGNELIYYQNRISNEELWRTMHLHGYAVTIGGQTVLEQELKSVSGKQRLVWYWYRVAGINTTSQYKAKGLQLLGTMTGKSQASVVAVAVDIDDVDRTRQAMRDFLSSMGSSLSLVADGEF